MILFDGAFIVTFENRDYLYWPETSQDTERLVKLAKALDEQISDIFIFGIGWLSEHSTMLPNSGMRPDGACNATNELLYEIICFDSDVASVISANVHGDSGLEQHHTISDLGDKLAPKRMCFAQVALVPINCSSSSYNWAYSSCQSEA